MALMKSLRKLVDVVDVGHTKKGLKPKRKCQNEPRKKKKIRPNFENPVVPACPISDG